MASATTPSKLPVECGEDVMSPKAHGTSEVPVQDNLRYGCDKATADRICNFNRHYAEHSGYAVGKTSWLQTISQTEVLPAIHLAIVCHRQHAIDSMPSAVCHAACIITSCIVCHASCMVLEAATL
mmetsp:Transcript_45524/g.125713  ORF Transcript_45524/g.125713 Transcript_45524/m.125713 type:complete len:125 (+) Transcript_45524:172-546(+)